jgi:hypothetical protein
MFVIIAAAFISIKKIVKSSTQQYSKKFNNTTETKVAKNIKFLIFQFTAELAGVVQNDINKESRSNKQTTVRI